VPSGIWNGLKDGQHLNIRFVPADPSRNRPADWDADRLPGWVSFIVMAGMLIPASLLFTALRKSRNLLTDGRPVPAVVKAHSNAKGGKRARYEFRAPDGATVTGQSDPDRHPVPVGDIICVLYDEENPKRNAAYPLQLHRIKAG